MISEVTGIRRIRMLYLQLLYRCNFECLHCFHGKRLQHADAFTADEAVNLLTLMRDEYGTEAVTLLGGEPFIYRDLAQVVRYAKRDLGMQVEICTNGYRIERRLTEIAPDLDLLRVSLEGIGTTNDKIRKFGSYRSALSALEIAQQLGLRAGATMTVTSRNIDEVLPLARTLQHYGVEQLKLHCLRPVGNAADHPELLVNDATAYTRLRERLASAELDIEVILDEDLSELGAPDACLPAGGPVEIERIEADPAARSPCPARPSARTRTPSGTTSSPTTSTTGPPPPTNSPSRCRTWCTDVSDLASFESVEGLRGTGKSTLAPVLAAARGAVMVPTVPPAYQALRQEVASCPTSAGARPRPPRSSSPSSARPRPRRRHARPRRRRRPGRLRPRSTERRGARRRPRPRGPWGPSAGSPRSRSLSGSAHASLTQAIAQHLDRATRHTSESRKPQVTGYVTWGSPRAPYRIRTDDLRITSALLWPD